MEQSERPGWESSEDIVELHTPDRMNSFIQMMRYHY